MNELERQGIRIRSDRGSAYISELDLILIDHLKERLAELERIALEEYPHLQFTWYHQIRDVADGGCGYVLQWEPK